MLTLVLSGLIAAATTTVPPVPTDALSVAERALRHEANTLVAARRAALLKNDRARAQCYNSAIFRVQSMLDDTQATLERTRALHRVRGSGSQHRRLDAQALREVKGAVSRVRSERHKANQCAQERNPRALQTPPWLVESKSAPRARTAPGHAPTSATQKASPPRAAHQKAPPATRVFPPATATSRSASVTTPRRVSE